MGNFKDMLWKSSPKDSWNYIKGNWKHLLAGAAIYYASAKLGGNAQASKVLKGALPYITAFFGG